MERSPRGSSVRYSEHRPQRGGDEGAERRRERRLRRRRVVRVDPGGTAALTGDVSRRGVFVLTARVREPGTRVQLTFYTPRREVRAEGLVRWVRSPGTIAEEPGPIGMGIEFVAPEAGAGSPTFSTRQHTPPG